MIIIILALYVYAVQNILNRFDKIAGPLNFMFFFTLFHIVYTVMIPIELIVFEANRFSLVPFIHPETYIIWSFMSYLAFIMPFLFISKKTIFSSKYYIKEKLLSSVKKLNIFSTLYFSIGIIIFFDNILQAGSYVGNIALSEHTFYKYFINIGALLLSITIIIYTKNGLWITSISILIFALLWSLYSSDKNPLLTVGLGLLFSINIIKISSFKWLFILIIIIPIYSVGFSSYRSGSIDSFSIYSSLYSNSDPKGPFQSILVADEGYLKDSELYYGESYYNSFFTWVPEFIWGNRPDDLSVQFAKEQIPDYYKGLGLGFSPMAEGVMNFGFYGPFIHYLIVSLILILLMCYYNKLPYKKQMFKLVFNLFLVYYLVMMHRSPFSLPADVIRILFPLLLIIKFTTITLKIERTPSISNRF
jgi:oligosaccharide repeat unit polymerase